MALRWKRKIITAKVEGTYGVDSTPTGAADAILARNVSIEPLNMNYDQREFALPWFGGFGKLPSGGFVKLDFEVECSGGGAAGTAPAYGPLLKGCGMGETINAGVSAVYAPVATETSMSIYFYLDGRLHKILGSLGTCSLVLAAGKTPIWKFSFVGLFSTPTDTALAAPTLSGYIKPVPVNSTNTTPATLHTFSGKFESITLDVGNVIQTRQLVGSEAVGFSDRKSVGSVVLADELIATKDWWTIAKAGTTGAIAVTHGTVAGNKVALAGTSVQLSNLRLSEKDGISMLSMDTDYIPSAAGNDEFSITVT